MARVYGSGTRGNRVGGESDTITPGIVDGSASPVDINLGIPGTDDGGIGEPITVDGEPDSIDPTTIAAPQGTGKRRGRKPGTKNKSTGKTTTATVSLSRLLFSLHLMGASFLKINEIAITEEESKALAVAVNRVTEYYGVAAIPEAAIVWLELVGACGSIYGPRILARSLQAKKKHQPTGAVPIDSHYTGVM